MNYYIFEFDKGDRSLAWVRNFPETIAENKWKLKEGITCSDWFPEKPEISLCAEKGVKCGDIIPTYGGHLIISSKLRGIFDDFDGIEFEYFPVSILDKKDRAVEVNYYMANLLTTVDCVDMDKSKYRMGHIVKDQVNRFLELVLDEERINEEHALFRLKDKTDLLVASEDLARAILEAGCTGAQFGYIEDHGAILRD